MSAQQRYLEALARSADLPVILQLDVGTVFQLVSVLQLALRHPAMQEPGNPAATARGFIRGFQEQVREREPLLADLVEMGNHPEQDA